MKRIILILTAAFAFTGCYVQEQVPTRYRDLSPLYRYYYDPIYDFYPNPYLYRPAPRTIIVTPAPKPKVRVIQEPRRNAFGPTAPPSAPRPRPQQSPIRTFPKRDDKR
jgi:hypothetical protein